MSGRLGKIVSAHFVCFAIVAAMFMPTVAAGGETVEYGGGGGLSSSPTWTGHTGSNLYSATSNTGNTIVVEYATGTNPNNVYGGMDESTSANGNTVILKNGTIGNNVYGGLAGAAGGGDTNGNAVTVEGGTVGWNIVCAYSLGGHAKNNTVTMTGGTVTNGIWGGEGVLGAEYNTVRISGSSTRVLGRIIGAYSAASANHNLVSVSDGASVGAFIMAADGVTGAAYNTAVVSGAGTTVGGNVSAAYSRDGDANHNTVYVTDASITGGIWVGETTNGAANNNSAYISGATIGGNITAGWSAGGGIAGNRVEVSSSSVSGFIYGGYMASGGSSDVTNNRVDVVASTVVGRVYGGYMAGSGDVVGNVARITDSSVTSSTSRVFGGQSLGSGDVNENGIYISNTSINSFVYGGYADKGGVAGNHVEVLAGSSIANVVYGGFGATNSTGDVVGNTVRIVDSATSTRVVGGASTGSSGDTNENRVYVYGASTTIGGSITGGSSSNGSANGNIVTIAEGTISGAVIGGSAGVETSGNMVTVFGGSTGDVIGGRNAAVANGNRILLSGGTISGVVAGADLLPNGVANDNIVTLSGTVDLSSAFVLGWLGNNAAVSGNTLIVDRYSGSMIEVNNFEKYDFRISSALAHNSVILSTSGTPTDLTGAAVAVTAVTPGALVASGTEIVLIDNTTGTSMVNVEADTTVLQGTTLQYKVAWEDDGKLRVIFENAQATEESKAVAEGRSGSLAFLGQGQDFIVNSGLSAAGASAVNSGGGWSGAAAFAAVGGGSTRTKTGSHVDVDGVSMLTGLAWRNNGPLGSLLLGAFFEAGYADYETRNAFSSGVVRGDGDSHYFGGGILARYDWDSGLYAEASGRVGGVKNDFTSDLVDAAGNRAKYDTTSVYYGAHAGLGYAWQFGGRGVLDVSAKYLWGRQSSESVVVTGDRVDFEADNSHRARAGLRFSYAANEFIAPYAGAAFEYEFDGKSRASVYGMDLGAPSLKGGTGVGEIGVTVRRCAFAADIGIQGHVGRRDGVTGSVRLRWDF